MTATADLLALLDSDPAAGILAAADLREQRAKAATGTDARWLSAGATVYIEDRSSRLIAITGDTANEVDPANAEHIAAEASPAHSLAAIRRWRGVVERHVGGHILGEFVCRQCEGMTPWPCADIRETADEARAYLGGAS